MASIIETILAALRKRQGEHQLKTNTILRWIDPNETGCNKSSRGLYFNVLILDKVVICMADKKRGVQLRVTVPDACPREAMDLINEFFVALDIKLKVIEKEGVFYVKSGNDFFFEFDLRPDAHTLSILLNKTPYIGSMPLFVYKK